MDDLTKLTDKELDAAIEANIQSMTDEELDSKIAELSGQDSGPSSFSGITTRGRPFDYTERELSLKFFHS